MVMARTDLRQPRQRAVLHRFLADAARPETDLAAWSDFFPNNNLHLSNNLLTRHRPTPIDELEDQDRASLEVLREWSRDPALARSRPYLARVEQRLSDMLTRASR
jgi:hypothetical protein